MTPPLDGELSDDDVFGPAATPAPAAPAAPAPQAELSDADVFGTPDQQAPAPPSLTNPTEVYTPPFSQPVSAGENATRPPPNISMRLGPAPEDAIGPADSLKPLTPQETFAGASRGAQLGYQIQQGVEGLRGFGADLRVMDAATRLHRIQQGLPIDPINQPGLDLSSANPEEQARAIDSATRDLALAVAAQIAQQRRSAQIPSSPRMQEFSDQIRAGDYRGAAATFFANPGELLQAAVVPGAITAAPALAVGAAGGAFGAAGGLIGLFGGSFVSRLAPATVEALNRRLQTAGVDINNPDAVAQTLANNPAMVQEAFNAGGQGALAGAAVDMLASRLFRPILPQAGIRANAGRLGGNLAVGALEAPTATAAQQLASEGEITDKAAIAQSGLAGLGLGAMGTAIKTVDALGRPQYHIDAPFNGPAEPAGPMIEPPGGPRPPGIAPPSATPPGAGGQPPVAPAPPTTPAGGAPGGAATGGTPNPTFPAGSTFDTYHLGIRTTAEIVLPPTMEGAPAIVRFPDGADHFAFVPGQDVVIYAGQGYQRAPTTVRVLTTAPDGQVQVQAPEGPRWIDVGQIVVPGAPPPAAPTAATPRPATPAESFATGLSDITNDPRTGTQIAADDAAANQQRITAVQEKLPPGMTIEPMPGGLALMDEGVPIWQIGTHTPTDAELAEFEQIAAQQPPKPPVPPGTASNPTIVSHPDHIAAATTVINENPTPGQKEAATTAYEAAFSDGSGTDRIGAVTPMAWDGFKQWLKTDTRKSAAYVPPPPPLKLTTPRRLRTFKEGPLTLAEFLALNGGIRSGSTNAGDLEAIGAHRFFIPRAGMLVRKNGRSLDYAREAAAEQGYLPQGADLTHFLGLIDQEIRGFPVYAGGDQAEIDQARIDEAAGRERDAMNELLPDLHAAAQKLGVVFTPDQFDFAAHLMLDRGHDVEAALAETALKHAADMMEAAEADAPKGYNPDDDELQYWADQLKQPLTPEQQWQARDLWEQGWHPAQAVYYAGAVRPALDAFNAAAIGAQPGSGWDIPFGGEGNVGHEWPGPGPVEPDGGADNRPPSASEQPAGPAGGAEGGHAPSGEQSGGGGRPAAGSGTGNATVPSGGGNEAGGQQQRPQQQDTGSTEPGTPRPQPSTEEAGGGAEFSLDPGLGEQSKPARPGKQGEDGGRPGGDTGLFQGSAAQQGSLEDAIKATRDVGNLASPNLVGLGKAFAEEFLAGREYKTIVQARKAASNWLGGPVQPGTRQAKIVDEGVELGAVMAAREIVKEGEPGVIFDRLLRLYQDQQPTLGVRTGDSIERQAYSTPLPLAYAASRLVNAAAGKNVAEPTAGNGALLIEVDPANATKVNELDPERVRALEAQGFEVRSIDATTFAPHQIDVGLANPPFGTVKEPGGQNRDWQIGLTLETKYSTTKIDHKIAFNMIEGLTPDGRAVLILGGAAKTARTEEQRRAFYRSRDQRAFFSAVYSHFNVVDHFTVAGELYEKQGAGWPVDVIVIDGRRKSDMRLPAAAPPRIINTWDGIKELAVNAKGTTPGSGDNAMAPGDAGEEGVDTGQGPGGGAGNTAPTGVQPGGSGGPSQLPEPPDNEGGVDAGPRPGPGGGGGGSGGRPGSSGTVRRPVGVQEPEAGGGNAGGAEPGIRERPDEQLPAPAGEPVPQPSGSGPGAAGNGPVRVDGPSDTGAKPPRVTKPRPQKIPANSETASPPDTADESPVKPDKKALEKDKPTATQLSYEPMSENEAVGTLAPLNLADAMQTALKKLNSFMHGGNANGAPAQTIDEWVAEHLGYTEEELQKYFSAEQVDALALGIHQIDRGQAFVIGDQTGVGKGRFVAGMIRYSMRMGKIPIFVTEKPSLYKDIVRDLIDIGMPDAMDQIVATNNNLRLPLTSEPDAPILRTPVAAKHEPTLTAMAEARELPAGKKMVFTTYSQMQQVSGRNTNRQTLLTALAPNAFLILDESHNAGGQGPGQRVVRDKKTGMEKVARSKFVRNLVDASHAVVYSSATWAKNPGVMDLYARKTDMRLAVDNIDNLADVIASGGVPMQQIVSAQLASVGQFSRRERSFDGVTYDQELAPVDRRTYDENASLMSRIFNLYEDYVKPVIEQIRSELDDEGAVVGGDTGVGGGALSSVGFGSTMHNVVAQMLLAGKAKAAADMAIKAIEAGEKPVITVANTMGAILSEYATEGGYKFGEEMPLSFNDVLLRYLKRQLRYTVKDDNDNKTEHWLKPEDLGPVGARVYYALEKQIRETDLSEFPASPIDYITNRLQAAGYKVGEITGRNERVRYNFNPDGSLKNNIVTYENRPGNERTQAAKNRTIDGFNDGRIDAAIINQSGAAGVSMHAYFKFKDQRPRMMIIVQAEANIDVHMQLLGRIHRTGQTVLPRFVQLVADVPAEKRPAAVLAKKMASLSASTTASRRGLLGSTNTVDFMNKYGGQIVAGVLAEEPELIRRLGLHFGALGGSDDEDEGGDQEVDHDKVLEALEGIERETLVRKFTGRIPLLHLPEQEAIYDKIEGRYIALIEELDAAGENALEAKTLDLRAVTLDSTELKAGAPGDNPFSAAVNLERVDVRRTSKPPPPHAVVRMVAAALHAANDVPATERLAEMDNAELAREIQGLTSRAEAQAQQHAAQVSSAETVALEKLDQRFRDPAARDRAAKQIKDNSARMQSIIATAPVGAIVNLATKDAATDRALTIGVKADGANLSAPSAWTFTFLMPDGLIRQVAGSGLFTENWLTAGGKMPDDFRIITRSENDNVHDLLNEMKDHAASGREQRFMVTGNLLAGYSVVKGQILNYTDNDGKIRQGILLRRDFNATRFIAQQAQPLGGSLARDFLRDREVDPPPFLESNDGVVRIVATDNPDILFLDVPLAKADGSKFFTDPFIRRNLEGGDFVSSGNRMRGRFPPRNTGQIVGGVETILRRQEKYLISTHPLAKTWVAAKKAGKTIAEMLKELGRDQSGGFDMGALMDLLPKGVRERMEEYSSVYGNMTRRLLDRLFNRPSTKNITTTVATAKKHIDPVSAELKIPSRLFRGTGWEPMVRQGIVAEEKQSKFIQRFTAEYRTVKQTLNKAGGSFDRVTEALFAGDAAEIDAKPGNPDLEEHFQEFGLAPSERRAYFGIHRILQKVARLHDMHNRAMMPSVVAQQRAVWLRMERLLSHASTSGVGARALYVERRRIAARLRAGKGDPIGDAERMVEIENELRAIRMNDPKLQDELAELQDTYDELEARLQKTMVRNRRPGYVPHKFFGNYRVFRFIPGDTEDEAASWKEMTSDQGFFPSFHEALKFAERVYAEDNSAVLQIREKRITWPETTSGTELSDRAYRRFNDKLADMMPDAGEDEIRELVKGVAKRRYRRRTYAPGMFRKGMTGYSEDMDRVLRTHIGQTVRYVVMDKLKYDYINRHEAAGYHRSEALMDPADRATKRAIEAWWRDVNGGKQDMEALLDGFLLSPAGPAKAVAALGLGTVAIGMAIGLGPIVTPALAGYVGWRLWNAANNSGQFPTRSFMGSLVSDQAHLKLGLMLNLHSAAVNLTQTVLTTYPKLGFGYTGIGIQKAVKGLWDQTKGIASTEAKMLQRANIISSFHMSEANQVLAQEASKWARASMFAFQSVETFNRAVAFFGGYQRALDQGMKYGPAVAAGEKMVRDTQFHYGNADKAAILRRQILRSPLQFKNFMFHMIAYVFGLSKAEAARFYPAMWVVAGLLGQPGLQLLDATSKAMTGFSPSDTIHNMVIDANKYGNVAANAATVLAHGLPGLITDMTRSVGMGDAFLPTSLNDALGPMFGTVRQMAQAHQKDAGLVDQLNILSPSFKILKAMETAANGNPITSRSFWTPQTWQQHSLTSWQAKGATVYHPSLRQILMNAATFTPIEQTIMADYHYRLILAAEERKGKNDAVLAEIAMLVRMGRADEVDKVVQQAIKDGLELTKQQIQNAIRGVFTTEPQRDIRLIPRRHRGEEIPRLQGVERRLNGE